MHVPCIAGISAIGAAGGNMAYWSAHAAWRAPLPQVTLDAESAELIEHQIARGHFRTPDEVIRAGLRLLGAADIAQRREEIRVELARRAADDRPRLSADELFTSVRAAIADRRGS